MLYNNLARSHMIRPVQFDAFLARCRRQGKSQAWFSRLHPAAEVMMGRPMGYPFGCDASFDCAMVIGQHAKAGTAGSHGAPLGTKEAEAAKQFLGWHERPSLREWTGIAMVAGGVLVLAFKH